MIAQLISDKIILIALTIMGMAICSVGIGQVSARGEWLHPLSIVAYVLGGLVLLIAAAALLNISLPLIPDARAAWVAILVLAIAKIALTQLHRAFA
jgi:hypothetical protein